MKKRLLYLGAPLLMLAGASSASAEKVLHYTFDEGSTGNAPALDSGTGTPAPGTFAATATRTGNTPGNGSIGALDTTAAASNSYVNAGDVVKLDGLQQLTLTSWINLKAAPANGNRIMAKQLGSGNFDGFSFAFSNPSEGAAAIAANNFQLNLALGGTGFAFNTTGVDLDAADKWLFVAVTYDGTQTADNLKFYTGTAEGPVVQVGTNKTANVGALQENANEFRVGASSNGTSNPLMWLDDARVYNEPLSVAALEGVRLSAVPEPTSLAAMALAGAGLLARRRRLA